MTDLTKAIETVQLLVPPDETPWQVSWIPDEAQTAIFYAAASGDMIPKADAKLAVAEAYRKAADLCFTQAVGCSPTEGYVLDEFYQGSGGTHPGMAYKPAILALADTDALAELQALRDERDGLLRAAHDNHEADKRAVAAEAELSATQDKLTRMSREFADFMRRHGPQDEFTQIAVADLEGAKP